MAITLSACVAEEPETEALGETVQALHGADSLASQSQANRAVALVRFTDGEWKRFCTGTLIDDDHVLTASHCQATTSHRVAFYTVPNQMDTSRMRAIEAVGVQPGVHPGDADYENTSGKFADIAILRLTATVGAPAVVAQLKWTYPGSDYASTKVGAGRHSDPGAADQDTVAQLRQIADRTDSPDDNDGSFLARGQDVDPGDSGGTLYTPGSNGVGLWVTGVLYGYTWDWDSATYRDLYTSVPEHLDWILDVINYAWSGGTVSTGRIRSGTPFSTFTSSELVCRYACDRTSACEAYNYLVTLSMCQLLPAPGTSSAAPGFNSDVKP